MREAAVDSVEDDEENVPLLRSRITKRIPPSGTKQSSTPMTIAGWMKHLLRIFP